MSRGPCGIALRDRLRAAWRAFRGLDPELPRDRRRLARAARLELHAYAKAAGLLDAPPSANPWLGNALDRLAAAEDAAQAHAAQIALLRYVSASGMIEHPRSDFPWMDTALVALAAAERAALREGDP